MNKMDTRQTASKTLLDEIANKADYNSATPYKHTELDNLLNGINLGLTPPFRMIPNNAGGDRVVKVEQNVITNSETGRRHSAQPIKNQFPLLTSGGTITFPATTGTITVTPTIVVAPTITIGASQYVKCIVEVDLNGNLAVTPGIAGSTEALATVPGLNKNSYQIGFIVISSDISSNINNIDNVNIIQFVGGGGAGGSGTGNSILETLKNCFIESPFSLLTPYVISSDTDTLMDVSSNTTYAAATDTLDFTNIGDIFLSKELADSNEFLNNTNPLTAVELVAFWKLGDIDTLATYEVSRNASGVNEEWQAIVMEQIGNTDTFRGILDFQVESVNQDLDIQSSFVTAGDKLNTITNQKISQIFTFSKKMLIRQLQLRFTKTTSGALAGNIKIQIVNDNAGSPSTNLSDIVWESNLISVSSISTGVLTVSGAELYLIAGNYHIVISTDQAYKSSYNITTDFLQLMGDSSLTPVSKVFNGTSYSASSYKLYYYVKGLDLNLKVRITAGTVTVKLEGIGLFYDKEVSGVSTGVLNREVVHFDGAANTYSFTLTKFIPNPDLLKVYDVYTGQVYNFGAFTLQGQTVVFESGQFYVPGQEVVLVFDQVNGGAFDNSDLNALLLANNHLGSTDSSIDKSVSGRGIFLRRPDGTLREICIDNSDNITVFSV